MFEVRPQTETPAGKRFAVVLSDVHIGNNSPTCWYQAAVHEHPLNEALAWILARRSIVREVVLLGDMFDVWTYPPSVRPPSMREIIAANPTMLGPGGPLAAVVRALPGQVRLLLGNHDGSLTRADIDLLNRSLGGNPSRGERIELVTDPVRVVDGASGARTVFSHGHHWCMFNAPDARSRWATIPIGHFVSRGDRLSVVEGTRLRPGETAADRPNSGNPAGVNAEACHARVEAIGNARRPRQIPARVLLPDHGDAEDRAHRDAGRLDAPPPKRRRGSSRACSRSGSVGAPWRTCHTGGLRAAARRPCAPRPRSTPAVRTSRGSLSGWRCGLRAIWPSWGIPTLSSAAWPSRRSTTSTAATCAWRGPTAPVRR